MFKDLMEMLRLKDAPLLELVASAVALIATAGLIAQTTPATVVSAIMVSVGFTENHALELTRPVHEWFGQWPRSSALGLMVWVMTLIIGLLYVRSVYRRTVSLGDHEYVMSKADAAERRAEDQQDDPIPEGDLATVREQVSQSERRLALISESALFTQRRYLALTWILVAIATEIDGRLHTGLVFIGMFTLLGILFATAAPLLDHAEGTVTRSEVFDALAQGAENVGLLGVQIVRTALALPAFVVQRLFSPPERHLTPSVSAPAG